MSIKVLAGSWRKSFFPALGSSAHSLGSAFLFVLFLGILAGGIVGAFSSVSNISGGIFLYLEEHLLPSGFADCLFSAGRFFLLAAFFSTSYLGVVLLPSLIFVRGCILSYSVSVLFSAFSFEGLLSALFVLGVPALINVPCFLIVCCGCFESSKCLFMQRFHALLPIKNLGGVWFLLLALFAIAFDCIYSLCFLPGLLERFF